MKQRITIEQLNELTEEQKKNLRLRWSVTTGDFFQHESGWGIVTQYVHPDEHDLPLLSIGQMIELIDQNRNDQMWSVMAEIESCRTHDLCNELWESVKIILE